jgi:hypothetical protein
MELINNVAKAHGLSFLLHHAVNCALLLALIDQTSLQSKFHQDNCIV